VKHRVFFAERRSHVPKTLLAVDDSATMRKVLEITFGGEDFRVITADGASAALSRLGEEPVAAVIDTSLGSDDGYVLAKELRSRQPRLALVVMASRYSPYDANRGRDAGVDDYIDKPFDTQALIEKVKKALVSRETREVAKPAPAVAATSFQQSHAPRPPVAPQAAPAPPAATSATATAKGVWPNQRTHTLSFEGGLPVVPPPAARVVAAPAPAAAPPAAAHAPAPPAAHAPPPAQAVPPTTVPRAPAPAPVAPPPGVAASPVSAAVASANGQLVTKLGDLGLTAQQADAVLALSREVVERVVWEVVPQLAEALIKEEIARLTKER
jgi:DNA-binding response OmpR family regulator